MSEPMPSVHAELSALILEHFGPNEWGQWKLRPDDAAAAILARFAVLALPEPTERTSGGAVWEWDADLWVKALAFPDGAAVTTSEGLVFYTSRGDAAEDLAATLCAAMRHARTLTESQTEPNGFEQ